jgi:hypothetical protein
MLDHMLPWARWPLRKGRPKRHLLLAPYYRVAKCGVGPPSPYDARFVFQAGNYCKTCLQLGESHA